jgi:NAD(P)-dependent dehydrogenase (short-subunit alcohol dehydrogenase family)
MHTMHGEADVRAFAGRKVFITGGSSGIGKQLATDFLRRGAHVCIAADGAEKLARAREQLASISPSVEAFLCDIADLSQIRQTAATYVARFGAPDVLVNNAGYAVYRTIEEMASEEIARLLNVNLTGACLVTREFLPSMVAARGGSVVMIASIAGRIPMTPCGPYSTAKHGMVTFSEILRAEVARYGIRVNVVCPGRVETEFFDDESFVSRAPRRETEWTIPIERVSASIIDAVSRNRFMTYVPGAYGPFVWLAHTLSFLARPMLQRLMRARIESVYAQKQLRDKQHESAS